MSGPARGTSSGAAQPGEEGLMIGDNAGDGRRLGRRVPLIYLERAAEDDPVRPREHVPGASGEGILHLRLRLEDGELAARGVEILVSEQVTAAEPGAVEDETLGQRRNLGGRSELANLELATRDLHVADHLTEVASGFNVHSVVA